MVGRFLEDEGMPETVPYFEPAERVEVVLTLLVVEVGLTLLVPFLLVHERTVVADMSFSVRWRR